VTDRLRLTWPDPLPFDHRRDPIRLLAVSDEADPSLESAATRRAIGSLDIVIGCGDLEPEYLAFVSDAFGVPLRYVRGNHDVGSAWIHAEALLLPQPLPDGRVVDECGLHLLGFSGSPRYNERGMQFSEPQMWLRAGVAALSARGVGSLLVVTHAPPRGANDDTDPAHRGFRAFRWLAGVLHPPLWLHGHTALVRRGLDARCARMNGTLFYNTTGATLVELHPPEPAA
jgi:hypothetical protein